ncbi:sigma-70 family RNA polymerase sigma factor [Acuticoccus sp. MNP-M23]|uniref:sigma-70 family RNA polymerase sigma factor n=1 Tax=Acuticoccus sp. MNP-M23 TaxID=3072793 RepID=UPI002814C2E0|nr:sigma-70 family RNA polymerase sigma factor [Acuticoccus sp. MNP-M23]WMS42456.1 sigma-70 family RNA polymerase sigma factor [Acuticoccus sp. MNP-M23]
MNDVDFNTLIERTALGDRAAFRTLYNRSSPKLFAVALRILQERNEAEDALQDAYVKIWRYAERFSASKAAPMTWMAAIVRNVAIDRLRARKAPSAALDAAERVADTTLRPDEKAMANGFARVLLNCINGLGDPYARLVRMAYFGGVTYAALAERDNVPLGTVKSRMRRALADLKGCVSQ